ncbi:hypothetical protein DXG01_006197, partial [Tephrocybe rancida]
MIPRMKKDLMKERPPTPSYTPSVHPRNTLPKRGPKIPALIFVQHGQTLAQNSYLPPCVHPTVDPAQPTLPVDNNPFLDGGDTIICGCFASAPLEPTLAVNFKVLEFVSTLFLNVAPNNTGWTDTVETFLTKQGYKLAAEGSLRKQFGNVLVWYNVLQDATTHHVDQVLCIARRHAIEIDDGMDISKEFEEGDPLSSPSVQQPNQLPSSTEDLPPNLPQSLSPHQPPQMPLQSPCTPHCHLTAEDDNENDIPIAGFKRGRNEENIEESELSNPFPDPTAC